MKRRNLDLVWNTESLLPSKKSYLQTSHLDITPGEVLTDLTGKKWKLGKAIGQGGFGEIYLASDVMDCNVNEDSVFVAKIEEHSNGPLFVEINCYLRIAKKEMINDWKTANKLKSLGVPNYVASGSHFIKDTKYRFLIIPRYKVDIEDIFIQKKRRFNLKTVLTIALQLIDILQYIHSKGYIHGDIKASNIAIGLKKKLDKFTVNDTTEQEKHLVRYEGSINGPVRSCRLAKFFIVHKNLRSNSNLHSLEEFSTNKRKTENCKIDKTDCKTADLVYLIDYGLASKYLHCNGTHKDSSDERRAHAGTILFCSLDAHKGILSRRSDLESLGYNIIYWLTSDLPWYDYIENPEVVEKKKEKCISNLEQFLVYCFGQYPKFLFEFFKHLNNLQFTQKPDYNLYKKLFINALRDYGYKHDGKLDFNNLEGWGSHRQRKKVTSENLRRKKINCVINRTPLKSNLPIRPLLRKTLKNNKIHLLKWSKILMDPEIIMKQAKEKKVVICNDNSCSISDINSLNPTEAMLSVYNNIINKSEKQNCDREHIPGYTSAMMQVYNKIIKKNRKETNKSKKKISNPTTPKKKVHRRSPNKQIITRNRSRIKRIIKANNRCPCCEHTTK